MEKRYEITSEFVFEDCLVKPSAYEGVLKRLDAFVAPFISHLHARTMQGKARAYMKGLLSDTERKNCESIAYFFGEDRQKLQKFIGSCDWDDEEILDKLAVRIAGQIGEEDGVLILDPTSFPKKGKESVGVQRQWCGRLGHLPCRRMRAIFCALKMIFGTKRFTMLAVRLRTGKLSGGNICSRSRSLFVF